MSPRMIGISVALFAALSAMRAAPAQTFLQRITEQLQQNVPREGAPPLQPLDRPATNNAPSNNPREALPAPRELSPAPTPARGSLGLRVSEVTDEAVRVQKLVVRRGALITAIEKGSAAERGGLPVGGVIVAFDGRRVDSPQDLGDAVRATRPDRDVEITYYQGERLMRKKVHLAPGQTPDISATDRRITPAPAPAPPPAQPSLGQQLGGNGSRPLLGRIGRVLESVVAPAQAVDVEASPTPTVANRIDPNSELQLLRSHVDQLQRQVDTLQKSIDALEKRLAERK